MKERIKAVQTAATVKDGNDGKTAERTIQAINSNINSTTTEPKPQGFIQSFLRIGAASATSTSQLMELTGLDARAIRKEVERERRNGILILSGNNGYFLPSDGETGRQEIEVFYRTARAKALSLLRTLKETRLALEAIDGQQSFEV